MSKRLTLNGEFIKVMQQRPLYSILTSDMVAPPSTAPSLDLSSIEQLEIFLLAAFTLATTLWSLRRLVDALADSVMLDDATRDIEEATDDTEEKPVREVS